MRIIAGFIAGLIVALGSSAVASTHDRDDDVRTTCHAWAKSGAYQCNIYAPDFDLLRVKIYENDEYSLGLDYEPGWVGSRGKVERLDVR